MNKRFVAIGHITNDTEPVPHLGGGVTYSAIAAKRLGYEAHIITKCPSSHPYTKELENFGINVHVLPTKLNTISTHQNIYDEKGIKKQKIWDVQESITRKDFDAFPKDILKGAEILLSPMNVEVDLHLSSLLSKYGNISIEPSGYFRRINNDGRVTHQEWTNFNNASHVNTIVLGEEEVAVDGLINTNYLRELREFFPTVVVTEGEKGCKVFIGEKETQVSAFPLINEEVKDLAGAGDVFATAYLTKFKMTGNQREAAVFASFFAAVKIAGLGGLGIDSVPTVQRLDQFKNEHMAEVMQFLKINSTNADNLIL